MRVFIYSHTHWDREWYLSQNQLQYRLVRTVDEILEVLKGSDSFTQFVFDGQTCILEDYLEVRPERADDLRRLIGTGRLTIGPWFTMPDTFLPDGESLIRNLARGWADCQRWGAPFPNVGYVPDSFGHVEQMPQILQGVGIDNFEFSRGLPEKLDRQPDFRREFHWESPDGSSVLAIHLPSGYHGGMFLPPASEPEALVKRIEGLIEQSGARTWAPDCALVPHGIDHCWLQRDIGEILEALPGLMPGVEIHHGSLQDFVDACRREVEAQPLDTYRGQLRGRLRIDELHGTLSSRVDNKQANERASAHLESLAEPLDAVSRRWGHPGAGPFLSRAWRHVLHCHAHDSICGCSHDRVHDDVNTRLRQATELGIEIADSALDYLNNDALRDGVPTAIVYGGLHGGCRVVDFTIRLPGPPGEGVCFRGEAGTRYAVQVDAVRPMKTVCTNGEVEHWECRGCAYVPDLAPCEVRRLVWDETGAAEPPVPVTASTAEVANGLVRLGPNANGTVDVEDLCSGARFPGLHSFVQDTDIGGGYHFERLPRSRRRRSLKARAEVRILSAGPLRATAEVTTPLRVPAEYDRDRGRTTGRCTLRLVSRFTVEAGNPVVGVVTELDNRARNQRLRVVYPSGCTSPRVQADAAFSAHDNASGQWPGDADQQSHPMRSAVTVSEPGRSLSVLTRGLHEYATAGDGVGGLDLEVTLMRCVDAVVLCSTWATPGAQLQGRQVFEYGLLVHGGEGQTAAAAQASASFRHPPIANIHGDVPLSPDPYGAHAVIGYYEQVDGHWVMRDPNRSPWKVIHSQRDGWKRLESDRFVERALPRRVVPFVLEGEDLVISAFKRAEDGGGEVLRFWNAGASEQVARIRPPRGAAQVARTDLLERATEALEPAGGWVEVRLRPFEIATVRWEV